MMNWYLLAKQSSYLKENSESWMDDTDSYLKKNQNSKSNDKSASFIPFENNDKAKSHYDGKINLPILTIKTA
jgi:hypothetical protein